MSAQAIFRTAVLVAGADDDHITEAIHGRLDDWVEYKRDHLPGLIETIVDSGEWHLPAE